LPEREGNGNPERLILVFFAIDLCCVVAGHGPSAKKLGLIESSEVAVVR